MEIVTTLTRMDPSFAREVMRRSGENVLLCYQCRKCASGCPAKAYMTATPTEMMRLVALGQRDRALKEVSIWSCLSCHTCSARCPQGIDIAGVIDTLRVMARERKVRADTRHLALFNSLWMTMLSVSGRMYEVGLILGLNLFSGRPFKDVPLGVRMLFKRKLNPLPSVHRPFEMTAMFARARALEKKEAAR